MGILGFFKKKKKDDFDLLSDKDSFLQTGKAQAGNEYDPYSGQYSSQPFGTQKSEPYDTTPEMPGPAYGNFSGSQGRGYGQQNDIAMVRKELELISSKLDSVKAMLDSLNQRVHNIEQIAYGNNPGAGAQTQNSRYNERRW